MQHASGARRIFHKIRNYSPCWCGALSVAYYFQSTKIHQSQTEHICIFGMQQQKRYENVGILTTMCTIGINKNRERVQTIQPHELRNQCRGDNCHRFLIGMRAPFVWVCVCHGASKRLQVNMLLMKMSRSSGVLLLAAVHYQYC